MIAITPAIVVEGTYDKIRLSSLVDTLIVPVGGFSLFKDKALLGLLRTLAKERGLLVLTDSDSAGFLIRNRIKRAVPDGTLFHGYIPDVYGKERRKRAPSAEGKIGVEGMTDEVLLQVLADAGVIVESNAPRKRSITKADFMAWGLSGGEGSVQRRRELQKRLGLPERLSANMLLEVLDRLYGYDAVQAMLKMN